MESCSIGFVVHNVHRTTARVIRNTHSPQRVHSQRERPNPPKVRRELTFDVPNSNRRTARAVRPTQSRQRVHFRSSQCAPRRSESDPTHPKSAAGSLSMFTMFTVPRRQRFNTPKARRGLISILKIRTAPQRERSNVRRGFTNLPLSEFARHHSESAHSKFTEVGTRLSANLRSRNTLQHHTRA